MDRISYLGFISHLRRINTPLSSSAKIRAPHSLHLSSWGFICPCETPDGGNIGLRKNLAILSEISFGTNSKLLEKCLFNDMNIEDIKQLDNNKLKGSKVFLNERLIGYTFTPLTIYTRLKLLKRNALINVYTSIIWNTDDNCVKISTDSGRCLRPVFVVNNNSINLTQEIIQKIKKDKDPLNWNHLIGGFLNSHLIKPYDDNDPNYYPSFKTDDQIDYSISAQNNTEDIKKAYEILEKNQGIIEYVDCDESNNSLIAVNPSDLKSTKDKYNYCEINPSLILGVLANNEPFISMQQAPRALYGTTHGKQALGLFATNYRNRFDVKSLVLNYPQKPIIKTKMSKYLFSDELPHGINAIVALGSFSGYNQEDSIIFNLDSVKRGLFRSVKYRSYSYREELGNNIVEKIVAPDPEKTLNMKPGDYSKLDSNGIIEVDSKISENDILISKIYTSTEKDSDGNTKQYDNSEYVKKNEDGFIDRVYSNLGNDDQRYCKIRTRKDKLPEIGDKFASRHGQKGTIGMLLPSSDLPRTKDGIVPDLIVNPHAFPSRMTIAQFAELLLGKVSVNLGYGSEISSFSNINIDDIGKLLTKLNFSHDGNEVLYSGITGEQLDCSMFVGPTYYQRLSHQVSDKIQSRDRGAFTTLTQQPVGGRALGGGCRIGEMERDCLLSHGTSSFLKESFMDRSDKYRFWISTKSGMITAVNPGKKIYKDLSNDSSKQFSRDNKVIKKMVESSKSEFVCVESPFAFKLFLQELEASGISLRLISEKILQNWGKTKISKGELITIPDDYLEIFKPLRLDKSSKEMMKPFYLNYNNVKLLLMNASKNNFGFSSQDDLIDTSLSVGNTINTIEDQLYLLNKANYTHVNIIRNSLQTNNNVFDTITNKFKVHTFDVYRDESMKNKYSNKHNIGINFDNLDKFFENENKLRKYFENMSKFLKTDSHLILTVLDGKVVYDKLIQNNGIIDFSKKSELIWQISASNELKNFIKNDNNPSGHDAFNKKIEVNIGNKFIYNTYLADIGTILSIAKCYGFSLLDEKDLYVYNKYKHVFKKATDNCFNVINYDYSNISYGIRNLLKMHRYVILKKVSNIFELSLHDCKFITEMIKNIDYINLLPFFSNKQNVLADKKMFTKTDGVISKNQIVSQIEETNNLLINTNSKEFNNLDTSNCAKFVTDLLNTKTFPNLDNSLHIYNENTVSNTMNFIHKYLKISIYVKFVNKCLFHYVPIINIGGKSEFIDLINLDTTRLNNDTLIQKNKDILSKDNFFNEDEGSIDYLNLFLEQLIFKNNSNYDNEILTDYNNVIVGIHIVKKLVSHFYTYKYLFEHLSNNVGDAEFLINVLENPILKYSDHTLKIPVVDIEKELSISTNLKSHNLLPVFSNFTNESYNDISIPDVMSVQHTLTNHHKTPIYFPDKLSDCLLDKSNIPNIELILEKTPKSTDDELNLVMVFNYNRLDDPESDLRIWFKNNINKYTNIFRESNIKLYFYFSLVNTSDVVFPNYLKKVSDDKYDIGFTDNYDIYNFEADNVEEVTQLNFTYIDGKCMFEPSVYNPNTDSFDNIQLSLHGIIYISTNLGHDNLLTHCLSYQVPTVIVNQSDEYTERQVWYQNILSSYKDGEKDSEGNILNLDKNTLGYQSDLNSLDITSTLKVIKNYCLNPQVRINLKTMCDKIFNIKNLNDYMTLVINKISKQQSNTLSKIPIHNIKKSQIHNSVVKLDKHKVRFFVGKGLKSHLETLYDVKIQIKSGLQDGNTIDVTLKGDETQVLILESIIQGYNTYVDKYIYVKRGHIFKILFGDKGSNFEKLKQKYKLISIQKEDQTDDSGNYQMVVLLGSQDQINQCFSEMNEIVESARRNTPISVKLIKELEISEQQIIKDKFAKLNEGKMYKNKSQLLSDDNYVRHLIIVPKHNIYDIPETRYQTEFKSFIDLLNENLKKIELKISNKSSTKHSYEILVVEQDLIEIEDENLVLIPNEYKMLKSDTRKNYLNISKSMLWNTAVNISDSKFLSNTDIQINGNVIFNDQMLIPSSIFIENNYFNDMSIDNIRYSQIDKTLDLDILIISSKLLRNSLSSLGYIPSFDISVHKYCNLSYNNLLSSFSVIPKLNVSELDLTGNHVLVKDKVCSTLNEDDNSQSEDFNRILNLKTLMNVSENLSKEDINMNLLGGKPILKLNPQKSEIHLVKNKSLPDLNRIISLFYNKYLITNRYRKLGDVNISYYKYKLNYTILPTSISFISKNSLLSDVSDENMKDKILHFLKLYFDVNYPINVVLKQGKIDKLIIIDLNKQIPIFLVNIIKNVVLNIHTLVGELIDIDKSGRVTRNIVDNLRVKIIKKLDGNLDFELFIDDNSSKENLKKSEEM